MADNLRVTMVATGLGSIAASQSQSQTSPLTVIHSRTGTDDRDTSFSSEEPAVIRTARRSNATVAAMRQSGVDPIDIPAFLKRQAD